MVGLPIAIVSVFAHNDVRELGRQEWVGSVGGVMQWVGRNSLRLCIYSLNNKTLTTSKISAREITQFNIPPLSHFMSKCFINVLIIRRHRKVILKLWSGPGGDGLIVTLLWLLVTYQNGISMFALSSPSVATLANFSIIHYYCYPVLMLE